MKRRRHIGLRSPYVFEPPEAPERYFPLCRLRQSPILAGWRANRLGGHLLHEGKEFARVGTLSLQLPGNEKHSHLCLVAPSHQSHICFHARPQIRLKKSGPVPENFSRRLRFDVGVGDAPRSHTATNRSNGRPPDSSASFVTLCCSCGSRGIRHVGPPCPLST